MNVIYDIGVLSNLIILLVRGLRDMVWFSVGRAFFDTAGPPEGLVRCNWVANLRIFFVSNLQITDRHLINRWSPNLTLALIHCVT